MRQIIDSSRILMVSFH